MKPLSRFIFLVVITIFVFSCDSSKFKETSIKQFVGVWELTGRSMFNEMQIEISQINNSDKLVGKVIKRNNNKIVTMFVDSGDTWVSSITRKSNFQFDLTEKKVGSQLFGLYGQSTSSNYKVQFIDSNSFGLSSNNSDPLTSSLIYKRIKQD